MPGARLAYLDCVGGLAGDMLLAALLDAGASEPLLMTLPERLGLGAVEIDVARVERNGVRAVHVDVVPPPEPPPRTWRRMREIVEEADLPPRARARALAVFRLLAEAEAKLHGLAVDDVHFHEIGGVDTLVDICGAGLLLEDLAMDRIECSPLPYPRGLVTTAHGVLPVPAPATVELLRGAQIEGTDGTAESVTPTGAALASGLASAFGPPPLMTITDVGYGAGTDDPPERPNVVRVVVGLPVAPQRDVVVVETNLDDLPSELVPDAAERCFEAGALDVWTTPALMKKGRPGVVFGALCRPEDEAAVVRATLRETSALGVRIRSARRVELEREHHVVPVGPGSVRVKVGRLDGEIVNVSPEHDDCAALARESGRSVKSVWVEALVAAGALR